MRSMDPIKVLSEINQVHDKISRIIATDTDDYVESKLAKLIHVRNAIQGSELLNGIFEDVNISSQSYQTLPEVELIPVYTEPNDGDVPLYDFGRQESQPISATQLNLTRVADSVISSSAPTLIDSYLEVNTPPVSHDSPGVEAALISDSVPQKELDITSADDTQQAEKVGASGHTLTSQFVFDDDFDSQFPDHNDFIQIVKAGMNQPKAEDTDNVRKTINNDNNQLDTESEDGVSESADKGPSSDLPNTGIKGADRRSTTSLGAESSTVVHEVKTPAASHDSPGVEAALTSDSIPQNELELTYADDKQQTEKIGASDHTPESLFVLDDDFDSLFPDHTEFIQAVKRDMKQPPAENTDNLKKTINGDDNQLDTHSDDREKKEDKITESVDESPSSDTSNTLRPTTSLGAESSTLVPGSERVRELHQRGLEGSKCNHCNKFFVSLARHMRRVHNQEKTKKCRFCSYTAFDTNTLNYHVRDKHTLAHHHRCTHCRKGFNRKSELMKHQAIYPSGICISSSRFRQCSKSQNSRSMLCKVKNESEVKVTAPGINDVLKLHSGDNSRVKYARISIRKVLMHSRNTAKEKKLKYDSLTKAFFSVTLFPCVHPQCSEVFALKENLDRHKHCHMTTTAELLNYGRRNCHYGMNLTHPDRSGKVSQKGGTRFTTNLRLSQRKSTNCVHLRSALETRPAAMLVTSVHSSRESSPELAISLKVLKNS